MKKFSVLMFVAAFLSLPAVAQENSNSKWYVGIGAVQSSYEETSEPISGGSGGSAFTGTLNLEYEKTNFKIFAGTKLADNLAVEFQYIDFGKEKLDANAHYTQIANKTVDVSVSLNDIATIEAEGSSFGVALLYHFMPEKNISPFVKLGAHRWDMDSTINIEAGNVDGTAVPALSASESTDGTDVFFGAGVDFKAGKTTSVRLDVERLTVDDEDMDNFGISAVFGF